MVAILDATITLAHNTWHSRTANALQDARTALTEEPPNTTGIVNHSVDALEAVMAKAYCVKNMDQVLKALSKLPDTTRHAMVRSLWQFSNQHARHLIESTDPPSYDDAILLLHCSCAFITRTLSHLACICCDASALEVYLSGSGDKCIRCQSGTHGCDICNKNAGEPICIDTDYIIEAPSIGRAIAYTKLCGGCMSAQVGLCSGCDQQTSHPHLRTEIAHDLRHWPVIVWSRQYSKEPKIIRMNRDD